MIYEILDHIQDNTRDGKFRIVESDGTIVEGRFVKDEDGTSVVFQPTGL